MKSTVGKIIASLLPALAIAAGLVFFHMWLRDLSNFDTTLGVILLFCLPFFIGSITAFLANLIWPVATNRKQSIEMAKPSLIAFFVYLMAHTVITSIIDPVFHTLEALGFEFLAYVFIKIPTSMLLLVCVAYFGWLGTRIRMRQNQ